MTDPSVALTSAGGDVSETARVAPAPILYGSLSRRIRALVIDLLVLFVGLMFTVILADAFRSTLGGRLAAASVWFFVLGYEPLLIGISGATIGHRLSNLHVVHDASGSAPGVARALIRFLIKSLLGVFSFAGMAFTRRYQSWHDQLTGTTVRIRHAETAQPSDYYVDRDRLVAGPLRSGTARTIVTSAWAIVMALAVLALWGAALSNGCVADMTQCSSRDRLSAGVLSWSWMCGLVALIWAGWTGRLPGTRMKGLPLTEEHTTAASPAPPGHTAA